MRRRTKMRRELQMVNTARLKMMEKPTVTSGIDSRNSLVRKMRKRVIMLKLIKTVKIQTQIQIHICLHQMMVERRMQTTTGMRFFMKKRTMMME